MLTRESSTSPDTCNPSAPAAARPPPGAGTSVGTADEGRLLPADGAVGAASAGRRMHLSAGARRAWAQDAGAVARTPVR